MPPHTTLHGWYPFVAARELFSNGVDNTQNLITETTYNARGLVVRQVDVQGNATLMAMMPQVVKCASFRTPPIRIMTPPTRI